MKARPVRPIYLGLLLVVFIYIINLMACADEFSKVKEDDIPGASLGKRKPVELRELNFWLCCRGDPANGLKTKAELLKRCCCKFCAAAGAKRRRKYPAQHMYDPYRYRPRRSLSVADFEPNFGTMSGESYSGYDEDGLPVDIPTDYDGLSQQARTVSHMYTGSRASAR